jgi:hypothetical protein
MDLNNLDNTETWQNDGKGNEFNNEISLVKKYITYFLIVNFFYSISMIFYYYFDVELFASEFTKKLLLYDGLFSDSDSSSSSSSESDSDSSSSESCDNDKNYAVVPEIKYEDKYLDDIKKMSAIYKVTWAELAVRDNKFNELYNVHKTNLVNEKYKLNEAIVEKSFKYIEIDDEIEFDTVVSASVSNINLNIEEKEERKKIIELEIIELRYKLKELEDISDDEVITKLESEAHDFVVKERLDGLKNNFIIEKTPLGNVIMYWNNSRESFEYYSDNTIPYRYLETVGRKYVKTFNCPQIYFDMEFELNEFERKQKEKQDVSLKLLENKKKMELEQNTSFNSILGSVEKKDVFAKFKNYNKESGTGKVNRGGAPPKNSIPNNNNMKKSDENVVLKENSNRYTCEGKLANFSILKKPTRKVIDKKYAMTFAEFKKLNL